MGSHTRITGEKLADISDLSEAPKARNAKAWANGPGTTINQKIEALKVRNIRIARLQRWRMSGRR
jgi:hypothetical protein